MSDYIDEINAEVVDEETIDAELDNFINIDRTYSFSNGLTEENYQVVANLSDANPLMNGQASAGTSTDISRADHIHPTDTSRASATDLQTHTTDKTNPHEVTKTQVGLGNVDNTADIDKPVSTAVQTELNKKVDSVNSKTGTVVLGASDVGAYTIEQTQEYVAQNGGKIDKIQKNGTDLEIVNKVVNITVPVTASDVSALPSSTKYGASVDLSINNTTYVVTAQLKDQDGNNLGSAKTIDLPLESIVVSALYYSTYVYDETTYNKVIVITLATTSVPTIIPVGELVSGLQNEITSSSKLSADLVDDTSTTNKFVTATDKTTWNGKQDAISDLETIRSGASAGASASSTISGYGDVVTHDASEFATSTQGGKADTAVQPTDLATVATSGQYSDLTGTPSIPTVNNATLTIQKEGTAVGTFTANASTDVTVNIEETDPVFTASDAYGITSSDISNWNGKSDFSGSYNDLTDKPTIPSTASDVGALPNSTKYGASLSVSGTSVQLLDQDGNNLGSAITTQDTDTGATSVGLKSGDAGNVVTTMTYDSTTRKITFEKGITALTSHQDISGKLDKKPDGTNDLIDNNKITTTYIPDYILGQVLYGGNVTTGAVASLTPSGKAKLGTSNSSITLTNDTTAITGYAANEGIYYIATADFTFANISIVTGDWLISKGDAWTKIDNTDAVTGVKGNAESTYRTGNINITATNLGVEEGAEVNDVIDVQINGTSILSSKVANILTNTAYDATTNKIATMSDMPTITASATQISLNSTPTVTTSTSGNTTNFAFGIPAGGVPFLTTAPTANNSDGIKFVLLGSEPATYYGGYIYFIAE